MPSKRTTITLDENLLQEATRLTGLTSVSSVVEHVLQEFIRRESQSGIMKLKGKVVWQGDLDAMRELR
jgi:Arc/MetJ family transcription regulator